MTTMEKIFGKRPGWAVFDPKRVPDARLPRYIDKDGINVATAIPNSQKKLQLYIADMMGIYVRRGVVTDDSKYDFTFKIMLRIMDDGLRTGELTEIKVGGRYGIYVSEGNWKDLGKPIPKQGHGF